MATKTTPPQIVAVVGKKAMELMRRALHIEKQRRDVACERDGVLRKYGGGPVDPDLSAHSQGRK
jgi:tRNA U55 pseudouridine synthase TruB